LNLSHLRVYEDEVLLFQTYLREDEPLSDRERKVLDFLVDNQELKLKDFLLADLSWANNKEERVQAFVDFFTKRMGKRILEILPEDIKNYILANSIK